MIPFKVSIDGIVIDRRHFDISYNTVSFHEAPPAGSRVYIDFFDGSHVFDCNGSKNVFRFEYDTSNYELQLLIAKAAEYKNHPAVADLLMQLRVVLELVNE